MFNTFVNCRIGLLVGIDATSDSNGSTPENCVVAGNIFCTDDGNGFRSPNPGQVVEFENDDQPDDWRWHKNVAQGDLEIPAITGIYERNPQLVFLKNGLAIPTRSTPWAEPSTEDTQWPKTDLLDSPRDTRMTLGAIQYSSETNRAAKAAPVDVGPYAERAAKRN
jgi:hypothetical protein